MAEDPLEKNVMVHLPSRAANATRRMLRQLGYPVLPVHERQQALRMAKSGPVKVFVFRIENPKRDCTLFNQIKKLHPDCKGIAFISAKLRGEFPLFPAHSYPDHLIPDQQPFELADLKITLKKILEGNIFGIEKYQIRAHEKTSLRSSLQKLSVLRTMRDYYITKRVHERVIQRTILILDELLMNAIFDAPLNAKGRHFRYNKTRSSSINLKKGERPQVSYGFKNGILALSVTDPFGSFEKQTFFSVLNRLRSERSINHGPGKGAGMGLFMIFRAVDELIINVEPGKKTEFIALLQSKFSEHKQRALHFFQHSKNGSNGKERHYGK